MAAGHAARRLPVPLLTFALLTFAWTWTMWGAAAVKGLTIDELPGAALYLLGVFGPLVGGAWIVHRGGRLYRREFLRRIWDPRGIDSRWWLALAGVIALPSALGGVAARLSYPAATVPDYSVGAIGAAIMVALVAGVAEEPGWRGAAADTWQTRTNPVWAATGIGTLWSVWHLPLHFLGGTWYHGMGLGSVRFWLIHLLLAQLGVLFVWLANGSRGSILIAILAHAGFNVAMGLAPESLTRDAVAFFVVTTTTIIVIAATRGQLAFMRLAHPGGRSSAPWPQAGDVTADGRPSGFVREASRTLRYRLLSKRHGPFRGGHDRGVR